MNIRPGLTDLFAPLPKAWPRFAFPTADPGTGNRPTLVYYADEVAHHAGASSGTFAVDAHVYLLIAPLNEKAEDTLDDALETVLDRLDAADWLTYEAATRVTYANLTGWRITITAYATKEN